MANYLLVSKARCNSILSDMAENSPALSRAEAIQTRVSDHGFDWPDTLPVFDKVEEEFHELKEAFRSKNSDHIEEELGDLLFVVVNLARHLNLDSETALKRSNQKFIDRFQYLEEQVELTDRCLKDCTLGELDALWDKAKKYLREKEANPGA